MPIVAKAAAAPRGRPRKAPEAGAEARERILDAAETLFALEGFYGVTTRQVAAAAGVDAALPHYYFDTKRGLFDAVFLRRAEVLNRIRAESLDRYERACAEGGRPVTVEGLIDAFIRPLLEQSAAGGPGWKSYFALVAQVNNTPAWGGETMAKFFDPVVHRLVDMLRAVRPDAAPADLYWSYQFLTGAMMLALSETGRIDRLSDGLCRSSDLEAVGARLSRYCAGGLERLLRPD